MGSLVLPIVLSAVLAQVYSAPRGCVELCNESGGFNTQTSESLSAFQTHAALQQSEALRNMHQSLQNQLHATSMNLGYTRPGNWTEHNQWATDGGAGKVHEERGQFESGPAKVQYYKKNYTASYGTGSLNNAGIHQNNLLNSQNLAGYTNQQSYGHQSSIHNGNAASIEDFSGQTGTPSVFGEDLSSRLSTLQMEMDQFTRQLHQFSMPMTTTSSLQTRMSELQTRVDQVNSQIQQTNHRSQNLQSPDVNQNYELHRQLQQLVRSYETHMRELRKLMDSFPKNVQSASQTSQNYNQGQNIHAENVVVPVSRSEHHYEYNSHQQVQSGSGYVPTSQNYVVPDSHLPQQETHVPDQRTNVYEGVQKPLRIPLERSNQYQSNREEHGQQSEYQQVSQNHLGSDSHQHDVYTRNNGRYTGQPTVGRHVEEHWSSSGHRSDSTIPGHVDSNLASERQRLERIQQQQGQYRSGSSHSGYQSGGSSSSYQHSDGQFRTGVLETGQTVDCDNESNSQYSSTNPLRYKRGIDSGLSQQTEDLSQHTQDFTQQSEDLTQQTQDFTQQSENLNQLVQDSSNSSQQHPRTHEHGQHHDHDHENRHRGDQETDDSFGNHSQSEVGNQRRHEHDHHQHHEHDHDHVDRHQHDQNHNFDSHQNGDYSQQTQDLTQQTQGFGDYSQQHTGNLEFGQQTQQHRHHEHDHDHVDRHQHDRNHNFDSHQNGDYSQQTQDLTQQTQRLEDFSQQHTGNLEFGQQTQQHRHHEHDHDHVDRHQHDQNHNFDSHQNRDSSQQTQDLTQQTQGFGDYSQQHTGNLEFVQQTQQHRHHDHDHVDRHQNGDYSQQTQDLTQQTQGFGDYSQQHTGNLELGQQTQQHHEHDHDHVDRHQNGDYSQQTQSGQFDFGQQTSLNLNQHSNNFGDYSQQSSANLELGQNSQQSENSNFGMKPAPKPVGRGQRLGNSGSPDSEIIRPAGVKGGRRIFKQQIQIPDESSPVVGIEEQVQQPSGTNWHREHQTADLTNENYQQGNLDLSQSSE